MKRAFHDLSVLFDDDGEVYVIWGYKDLRLAELDATSPTSCPAPNAPSSATAPAWARVSTSTRSTAATTSSAPGSRAACACPAHAPTPPRSLRGPPGDRRRRGLRPRGGPPPARGRFPPFDVAPPNTRADGRLVSAASPESVVLRDGAPTAAETWPWTETVYGDLILMSLATHRHLRMHPVTGALTADHPGPLPDRRDGSCFDWSIVHP